MAAAQGLSCRPGSLARPLAKGLAWLWRLDLRDAHLPDSVALATAGDEDMVRLAVAEGELAGAVVLGHAGEPAEAIGDFDELGRMHGRFTTLDIGEPALNSSLGTHAALQDGVLRVAAGPDGEWGRLTAAWVLAAIGGFLEGAMGLSLRRLPPLGVVRLDDFPGTAQLQVEGSARNDKGQRGRAKRMVRAARRGGSVVNTAVPARALRNGKQVPLDSVWPDTIAELRGGVADGQMEAVCHGLLHLDPDELDRGVIEFREFAKLDRAEADRRIELAVEWQTGALGRPQSFVAPAWSYSDGALEALRIRSIPHWMRDRPGPLVDGEQVFETLEDGPPGLVGLDYRPLAALARQGMPPVVVFHGRMLDIRHLHPRPRPWHLARLVVKRDLARLLGFREVRWIGCGELIQELRRHDRR